MNEIAFEAAIRAIGGECFGTVKAETWQGLGSKGREAVLRAEVIPSPSYALFYVGISNLTNRQVAFTRRPVPAGFIRDSLALSDMLFEADTSAWAITQYRPGSGNPFAAGSGRQDKPDGPLVYFIRPVGGGLIKIGHALDPLARLAEIQRMSPVQLEILALTEGGCLEEERLHQCFAHSRVHGEWFTPTQALLDYIGGLRKATLCLSAQTDFEHPCASSPQQAAGKPPPP